MSDLWGAVPQVRWSGNRVEPPVVESPTEPSVTANVAASGVVQLQESATTAEARPSGLPSTTIPISPGESGPVQTTSGVNPTIARTDIAGAATSAEAGQSADDVVDAADPQSVFTDTSVEQIERLKAALDDDAERAKSPPRAVAGGHDVRVRVESMLARARHLFDIGQTREARHTAKVAHDLGDSARLDYSPDEERPIDLVQRIDDHLRVTAEQAASKQQDLPETLANQPPVEPGPVEAGPAGKRDIREDKGADPESAKQRRDWGYGLTVFRRDRKPAANERANSNPPPAGNLPTVTPIPAVVLTAPELDMETDGAVMQANRSLSLAKTEEAAPNRSERLPRDASAPIALAPYQRREFRSDLGETVQDPPVSEPDAEVEHQDLGGIEQEWPREIAENSPRAEDEAIVPPVEFEEVKPLTPFRDVAGAAMQDLDEAEPIESPRGSSGWLMGAAIFGICAAVAIFWYRRGAT